MRGLKKLLIFRQCVFVRCELRLKKQLRTALFFVAMQHVVIISFQNFRTTDWCHLDFWILNS